MPDFQTTWKAHGSMLGTIINDVWYRIRINVLRALWVQRNKHRYNDSPLDHQTTLEALKNECLQQHDGLTQWTKTRGNTAKALAMTALEMYLRRTAHPIRAPAKSAQASPRLLRWGGFTATAPRRKKWSTARRMDGNGMDNPSVVLNRTQLKLEKTNTIKSFY
jgi:hypothetical protein